MSAQQRGSAGRPLRPLFVEMFVGPVDSAGPVLGATLKRNGNPCFHCSFGHCFLLSAYCYAAIEGGSNLSSSIA